jgi:hypothetical protein
MIGHTEIGRRDLARTVEDKKREQIMNTTKAEAELRGIGFLLAILKSNFGSQFVMYVSLFFSSEFGVFGLRGIGRTDECFWRVKRRGLKRG